MTEEIAPTVFEEGEVKITTSRIVTGLQTNFQKTYALSDITSVRIRKNGIGCIIWLLMLFGAGWLFLLYVAVGTIGRPWNEVSDRFWGSAGLPIFIILIAVLLMFVVKKFVVYISDLSGETKLLESSDEAYLKRIVEAINSKIAAKADK